MRAAFAAGITPGNNIMYLEHSQECLGDAMIISHPII